VKGLSLCGLCTISDMRLGAWCCNFDGTDQQHTNNPIVLFIAAMFLGFFCFLFTVAALNIELLNYSAFTTFEVLARRVQYIG
jgi:hypothetical protein